MHNFSFIFLFGALRKLFLDDLQFQELIIFFMVHSLWTKSELLSSQSEMLTWTPPEFEISDVKNRINLTNLKIQDGHVHKQCENYCKRLFISSSVLRT